MGETQVPAESDEEKSDALARRAGLRLSDAEIVATARRDMFGDRALREATAGPAPDPAAGHGGLPASAAAAPPQAEAGAAQDGPSEPPDPGTPDAAHETSLPGPPEGFSAGPPPDEHAAYDPSHGAPVPPTPELGLPSPHRSDHPEPTQNSAAGAPQLEVSPIFSALDAAETRVEETEPREPAEHREAAEPPSVFGIAMMMPPVRPDQEGLADSSTVPLSERPRFREELIRTPAVSAPTAAGAESSMTMAPVPPDREGLADSFPVPLPEPPRFREELFRAPTVNSLTASIEAAAILPAQELGEPPYPEIVEAPIPEPSSAPSELPEPPAEPFAGPMYPMVSEAQTFEEPEPASPAPILDAAAKIAAEAEATADALDNLKRLLGQKLPHLEPAAPSGRFEHTFEHAMPPPEPGPSLRFDLRADPYAPAHPAPLLPLPVAPPRRSSRGVYLLGFLTGLALSLMAGAALYFVLHPG